MRTQTRTPKSARVGRAHACWIRIAAGIGLGCPSVVDTGLVAIGSSTTTGHVGDDTHNAPDPAMSTGSASSMSTNTGGDGSITSGPGTTSSSMVSDSSDSGAMGETDGLEDSPCNSEQEICAQVELEGEPAGFCGQTLEIKGIVQELAPGQWSIQDCGTCELCGGPTYQVQFITPMQVDPPTIPLCSRIAIDFAPVSAGPWACAFVGMAIWGDDGLGEDPAPWMIAASITAGVPSMVDGLTIDLENIDPKACEQPECCDVEPGKYTLTWTGAGLVDPLVLEENDTASDVSVFGRLYEAMNLRSHGHEQCDRIPHFDWVLQR